MRYKLKKRGNTWIALDSRGTIIAIKHDRKATSEAAEEYFKPVKTVLNPDPVDFVLNHTYRVITRTKIARSKLPFGEPIIDVTAKDLTTALRAMLIEPHEVSEVKVYRSSGKIGTSGGVGAGWSKCTEMVNLSLPGFLTIGNPANGGEMIE
jgi:hypothetical protein